MKKSFISPGPDVMAPLFTIRLYHDNTFGPEEVILYRFSHEYPKWALPILNLDIFIAANGGVI